MLGDLSQEIIGTDPKYLPIVDHSWLNPEVYDNYPSDNNSVRIQPKLAELWGNDEPAGIRVIPNLREQPLGMRSAGEEVDKDEVVREAKKAMMTGLKGKSLGSHLRARFASNHIEAAKEELQKLSQEQGLLGNVYIDASAFSSADDAERFLIQHRSRLARDIIVNEGKISPEVVSLLASRFHKNVVASVEYDEKLFKKYKAHLIDLNHIDNSYVIDSKESLRQAFLAEPALKESTKVKATVEKVSDEEISENLIKMAEEQIISERLAAEDILFSEIRPLIVFAREQLSKGKRGNNLKEVLKKRYASQDLKRAAKYLAVVVPSHDMTSEIDDLVTAKRIPKKIASDLKKIIKSNPVKETKYAKTDNPRPIGVRGFFHVLNGKKDSNGMEEHKKFAAEQLRKGATLEQVKGSLMKELSSKKAEEVLLNAVQDHNNTSVGIKANAYAKPEKKKVVADLPERQTLPDPDTIKATTQEYIDTFAGMDLNIEIDAPVNKSSIDIEGLSSNQGLDGLL